MYKWVVVIYTELSRDLCTMDVDMFEYEMYVFDINDTTLLRAYLSRVLLRINALKVRHGIN